MSEGELLGRKLGAGAVAVAVIDGPYDKAGLAGILARPPISLGEGLCRPTAGAACEHGTFVIGLIGARSDLHPPGLCPDCRLLHIPLFSDGKGFGADVSQLAAAINTAVDAGANLVNLSLAVIGDDDEQHADLSSALDRAYAAGAVVIAAAGNQGRVARGQLLSHPATIPVVAVDRDCQPLQSSNFSSEVARRGVAALGSDVLGYGPGGKAVRMSGTSAATAVATGTLGAVWGARPDISGADIRAAVTRLGGRGEFTPPMLDRMRLIAALDMLASARSSAVYETDRRQWDAYWGDIQGGATMETNRGTGRFIPARQSAALHAAPVALAGEGTCGCGAAGGQCACGQDPVGEPTSYVYVLGTVEARFPDPSVEEEALGVARTLKNTENIETQPGAPDWPYVILKHARYIARQACWVLSVEGIPSYSLRVRDFADLPDLIECLSRPVDDKDLVLVVGVAGPVIQACPGIDVRLLKVDQVCAFTRTRLLEQFREEPKPKSKKSKAQSSSSDNDEDEFDHLFRRLVQIADNTGASDEQRALNFLAIRYRPLYRLVAAMRRDDFHLKEVNVRASRLSGSRRLVDPIFSFEHETNGVVKKQFVRVDVTHEFPMIATHLQPYFDR